MYLVSQKDLQLKYRGRILKQTYRPDFVCYEKIIVEVKAVSTIIDDHRAQLLNYLNGTEMKLGLIANFGHYPQLQHERLIR